MLAASGALMFVLEVELMWPAPSMVTGEASGLYGSGPFDVG